MLLYGASGFTLPAGHTATEPTTETVSQCSKVRMATWLWPGSDVGLSITITLAGGGTLDTISLTPDQIGTTINRIYEMPSENLGFQITAAAGTGSCKYSLNLWCLQS